MLKKLVLHAVGPAPEMTIAFSSRLNLVTGDNGLGKSFLLETAWWALTRTWVRYAMVPHRPPALPTITLSYESGDESDYTYESHFQRHADRWTVDEQRREAAPVVLFAQADGGFAICDPARNRWEDEAPVRPVAMFRPSEVWEGHVDCEGLVRDWASWQREAGKEFELLKEILRVLSPSPSNVLHPGELRRISLHDPRDYPTLQMPYGEEVAVVHASAGMRRILAVGYLLVWAWREHLASSQLLGTAPTREIVLVFDEVEAHLHPQWQRRIVPALLKAVDVLTGDHDTSVQLIAATHSPLVLASVEPIFDDGQDKLLVFAEVDEEVVLREQAWAMQGDVLNWLVSDTFGLDQARSTQAEQAIEAAESLMRGDLALPNGLDTRESIDAALRRVLPGHDPFWPRWVVWVERQGAAE